MIKLVSIILLSFFSLGNYTSSDSFVIQKQASPVKATFEVQATTAAVFDINKNQFIFQQSENEISSIASITKLMTALVFLENNPGWQEVYEITRQDRREGGRIYLYLGDKVLVKDLFYLSLVGSANTATAALVSSTGMSEQEFVQKMNRKAFDLGLFRTKFEDPVGLSINNVSTAKEVAILTNYALMNEEIQKAVLTKQYNFTTKQGKVRTIDNTDALLENFNVSNVDILGGKTGYNEKANYCFTGKFQKGNQQIISVVLGTQSKYDRFNETDKIVNNILGND